MNDKGDRVKLSRSVAGTLLLFGLIGAALLAAGRRDYPSLHEMLDTGVCLLSSILALLLWDIGERTQRPFPKWLAISFAVAALSELIHALVTVEWFGMLAPISAARKVLRPATWPIAGYVRPIGVGWSVWLLLHARQRAPALAPVLLILSAALFPVFYWLPRYDAAPAWADISRPWLAGIPLLWAGVGWACWRHRGTDRLLPALTLMAGVLCLSNVVMLYSREPHDGQAMAAHLGKIAGFLVLLLSLTQMDAEEMRERIRARQALTQANEDLENRIADGIKRHEKLDAEYAAIIESSDDAIIGKTLQGIITSWNAGAEKLFCYTVAEAVGQPMSMLVPQGRENEEPDILARLSHGQRVHHFETVRRRKDGTSVDISASISPVKDASGEIVGASKIARDVSERKLAERKLRMQLARLDLLSQITRAIGQRQDLSSILQVVVRTLEDELPVDFGCVCLYDAVDASLTVTCVGVRSAVLAAELGMPQHAHIAIDQNGLARCVRGQLVYEPDVDQVQFPFPQRLAKGGLRAMVAAPLQIESKVFGVLIAARRESASFSSGECEFLRQLSEHVALASHQAETHAALQRAYDDLRQTQHAVMQQERLRALGQMASGIAHDVNNAISPITLYTDSLLERESLLTPQGREQLQIIQQAIDDVARTVARLREFYRHREALLPSAPVQINPLIRQVADLTRARWSDMPQRRGIVIEMRTELPPDVPVFMGVESEIREALTNLVFNAVDAMADGGVLTLRTGAAAGDPHVYVEVNDTGIGMDEDTRRRCLEPFFTTKGERGTGLGLAMVYGVAQRHGAEIEIDSALGRGTTIRLIFPVQTRIAPALEPGSGPLVLPRLRILVVDDDPLLLKSLRDTLEGDGHDVVAVNGGQEGIDAFSTTLANAGAFDAVITDLGMPHIDGRKVSEAIKGLSISTPVILLTGWGQRLISEGDVPPHVDQVLSKPPKLQHLREALARCCGPAQTRTEGGPSA